MRNNKGFTLIEIIVVITLTSILLAISVPGVMNFMSSTKEDSIKMEGQAIVTQTKAMVNKLNALGSITDSTSGIQSQKIKTSILSKAKASDISYADLTITLNDVNDSLSKLTVLINGYYYTWNNGTETVTK